MIFEKQIHQENCLRSVLQALEGVNLESENSCEQILKNLQSNPPCEQTNRFPFVLKNRIDVLMETGTGKTFSYLNLIFEINRIFGKRKFMIVLPRAAIKLGTIQNIKLTTSYFFNIFGEYLNVTVYPEDGIQSVENNFLRGSGIDVLITTNSAFNSESNIINKPVEYLFSHQIPTIWESIANAAPLVIIDEPHLLKGKETQRGLEKLRKSTQVRFGATYPEDKQYQLSNVAFVLDSISAFNRHLVKRIAVSTLFTKGDHSNDRIHSIKPRKQFELSYAINSQLFSVKLHEGDDIGAKTGRDSFNGIRIARINKLNIRLSNGETWHVSDTSYELNNDELRKLIQAAVSLHFEREEQLFEKGIKALALFFIPSVKDFRGENPKIKRIFEEVYHHIWSKKLNSSNNEKYKEFLKRDFNSNGNLVVHNGYFAGDRGTKEEQEKKGVELILKDKQKLLSFSTPLRFIFSVWALQEGWDNPNIITLCKLRATGSEMSRRQQVGRGLRLCFDKLGKRQSFDNLDTSDDKFFSVNTLNVVVSENEHEFIRKIQQEIQLASFHVVGTQITLEDLKRAGLSDTEAAILWLSLQNKGVLTDRGTVLHPIKDWLLENSELFSQIEGERFNVIVELLSEFGTEPVKDNNKTSTNVELRMEHWSNFKQLWELINKQVYMTFDKIDSNTVINRVVEIFNTRNVQTTKQALETEYYDSESDEIVHSRHYQLEIIDYFKTKDFARFIGRFAESNQFPIQFITMIFNKIGMNSFIKNPAQALHLLTTDIKNVISGLAIESVKYSFSDQVRIPNELQNQSGHPKNNIEHSILGRFIGEEEPPSHFLFDKTVYDSSIELKSIINDPIKFNKAEVKVFAKLPSIRIPTPYRTYSPDFGYIIQKQNKKLAFLVVETKGYDDENKIPQDEQLKIRYAKKFFNSLQAEMDHIAITYKTRVNTQSLAELISEI